MKKLWFVLLIGCTEPSAEPLPDATITIEAPDAKECPTQQVLKAGVMPCSELLTECQGALIYTLEFPYGLECPDDPEVPCLCHQHIDTKWGKEVWCMR